MPHVSKVTNIPITIFRLASDSGYGYSLSIKCSLSETAFLTERYHKDYSRGKEIVSGTTISPAMIFAFSDSTVVMMSSESNGRLCSSSA